MSRTELAETIQVLENIIQEGILHHTEIHPDTYILLHNLRRILRGQPTDKGWTVHAW